MEINRAGKSKLWKKYLEMKPYTGPKLREPEVNLITYDECAEISPETWNKIKELRLKNVAQ